MVIFEEDVRFWSWTLMLGKKKSLGFCEIVIADYCKEWIDTNLIGSFVSFDWGLLESTLDFAEWYFYEIF